MKDKFGIRVKIGTKVCFCHASSVCITHGTIADITDVHGYYTCLIKNMLNPQGTWRRAEEIISITTIDIFKEQNPQYLI